MDCALREQHQTGIWSPPPLPNTLASNLDPNQFFVLSGPYPSNDHRCGIMIAHPIPPGATVIAKPVVPGAQQRFPLSVPDQIIPDHVKHSFAPKVMVWNTMHPEGQLVPLRQPEPTVYFNSAK